MGLGAYHPTKFDLKMHITVLNQNHAVAIVSGLKSNKNHDYLSLRKLFDNYVTKFGIKFTLEYKKLTFSRYGQAF